MTDIMKLIHATNPYDGFVPGDEDLHGWGGHPEFFEQMIVDSKPSLIIEVGSWKGRSAVVMGKIIKDLGLDTKIVCVDTWLGATEFWTNHADATRYQSLNLRNGYPQVYYQFLSNVVLNGLQDVIVPFPQTSTNAARFFKKAGVKADLIYIDASHEYEDVNADIEAWLPVLSEGGTMFGDDYCDYWIGVKRAVNNWFRDIVKHVQLPNEPGRPPSDYWIAREEE